MLTTEDEARKRWCPHSRRLIQLVQQPTNNPIAGMSANRTTEDGAIGACIASACMSWRWGQWESTGEYGAPRGAPTAGFCGLAGRP